MEKSIVSSNKINNSSAFTLVELAIVIVIIGLLVGGVLQGQELIKQAKIQGMLKNIESYKAATHTYKSKYGDTPGDSTRHNSFFSGANFVEGNGNGLIELNNEAFEYWYALGLAKLIKGSYQRYTSTTINSSNMPTDSSGISYIYRCSHGSIFGLSGKPYMKQSCWYATTKIGTGLSLTNIGWSLFSIEEAQALDFKIDDGVASSGIMIATGPTNQHALCAGTAAFDNGVTTGDYLTTNTTQQVCVPMFEFMP